MVRKSISLFTLALLSVLYLAPPTAAEDSLMIQDTLPKQDTAPASSLFSESLAVRVVNVEVFATDKKGNPVHGLTAEDFELYEDGRRVEISHFFAASDEGSAPATKDSLLPVEPLPLPGPQVSAPAVDRSKTPSIIAYIDNLNLRKGGRKRVLDDLGTFLESSVDQGSRVMIVVYDRGGLRPVLEPTTDKAQIAKTLDSIRQTTAEGFRLDLDRRSAMRDIRDTLNRYVNINRLVQEEPCELAQVEMMEIVGNFSRNVLSHNEIAASGMSTLIGALAGWPGLKSVIYVSDGLPQMAGTDLYSYLADICPEFSSVFLVNSNRFDSSRIFDRVTQQANANQVTIHTLEARGLTTLSMDSVDNEGALQITHSNRSGPSGDFNERTGEELPPPPPGSANSGRRFTPTPGNDQIRTANHQSTLFQLASATGGRAVLNANDFALDLQKIGADTRNYYSLGFTTKKRGDGKVHHLRVEVLSPKIRIRHRQAYRDKPAEETLVERALGALIFDFEDNPLAAKIEISQVPVEAGGSEVRLAIRIPQDKLTLLPAAQRRQGRLRLVLTARDANNKMLPIKQKYVPVMAGEGNGTAGEAQLEIGIDLPPGSHELVLAIRDEITTSTSYLRRVVKVDG